MASMSETSYWINFFTTAGIPAGDAAHYAIMFSDNRITREMLLDLSKEYLTDMGIARLGDIIAILKHAKSVFNQEAKDKILKSTSLSSLSSSMSLSPSSTPRRSTAASRMVNHITSKHPEAAPMSQSPVPKLPPPDPPRSKRKVSVFERLGADDETITLSTGPISAASQQSSVFSRLGGKSLKRAASSTLLEDLDDLLHKDSDSLPYAGVLKSTGPIPPKKANIKVAVTRSTERPSFKIKKTIQTHVTEEKKAAHIQRPEISTTTEGVLSDFAKKDAPSLKDRLGGKSRAEASSTTNTPSPKSKMFSASKSLKGGKTGTSIQDRLGAKREEQQSSPVVSSTQQIGAKLRKEKELSKTAAAKASGVFSRLGKKSQA